MIAHQTPMALLVLPFTAHSAAAQPAFPAKPVRLIVGSQAGGGNDMVGRILAAKLSENFGQQVVSLPFLPYLHPAVPAKTLGELIAHAKANPGKLAWSSTGDGGLPQLTGEMFKLAANIDTRRIPYKGSTPAFNDLLAGQVQYCIESVPIGLQHVRSGRLLVLATTGGARLPFLPDVPTLKETLPGLEVSNWYGMVLPAGTPLERVNRLHGEILKVMNVPEIRAKLIAQGTDPVGSTPAEFAQFRKAEEGKWARVINAANIRPQP